MGFGTRWVDGCVGWCLGGYKGGFFFPAALNDDTLKASFGSLGREGGWDSMLILICLVACYPNFSKTK